MCSGQGPAQDCPRTQSQSVCARSLPFIFPIRAHALFRQLSCGMRRVTSRVGGGSAGSPQPRQHSAAGESERQLWALQCPGLSPELPTQPQVTVDSSPEALKTRAQARSVGGGQTRPASAEDAAEP